MNFPFMIALVLYMQKQKAPQGAIPCEVWTPIAGLHLCRDFPQQFLHLGFSKGDGKTFQNKKKNGMPFSCWNYDRIALMTADL